MSIKKLIAYLLSYACFWIGDALNYQRFMHYSLKIQDWAGNKKPWNNAEKLKLLNKIKGSITEHHKELISKINEEMREQIRKSE